MPHMSEMFPSNYLKEFDVGDGQLWTVKSITHEEVGRGENAEMRWVMRFEETPKRLALNKTNAKKAAKVFGSENTEDWVGKQIVLYWDPEVVYGGDEVGGVRLRAPKVEKKDLPF